MSFAPRPINRPFYQRNNRSGVNLPPRDAENFGIGNKSNVADFTARRRQQFSQLSPPNQNPPQRPLVFPDNLAKSKPTPPAPNFVTPTPWWLRSLSYLKYGSGVVAGGLILFALTAYGSNVSTQQQWSEEFKQLESLRRTERQLVAANEIIKNQAAQQSAQTKQLVRLDPSRRVYLPTPSPLPQATSKNTAAPEPTPSPSKNSPAPPLGY